MSEQIRHAAFDMHQASITAAWLLPRASGPELRNKGTGHHLERNLVILRGHGFNSSAAPPGGVGRQEGWAAHGALGCPVWIAGLGLGICARFAGPGRSCHV
jgi:hypothetical protein